MDFSKNRAGRSDGYPYFKWRCASFDSLSGARSKVIADEAYWIQFQFGWHGYIHAHFAVNHSKRAGEVSAIARRRAGEFDRAGRRRRTMRHIKSDDQLPLL